MSPRAPDPTPDAPASTPGPLLVELVGPAGIGKSAVARLVERGDTDGERRLLAGDALERHDRLKGGQAVLARKVITVE